MGSELNSKLMLAIIVAIVALLCGSVGASVIHFDVPQLNLGDNNTNTTVNETINETDNNTTTNTQTYTTYKKPTTNTTSYTRPKNNNNNKTYQNSTRNSSSDNGCATESTHPKRT